MSDSFFSRWLDELEEGTAFSSRGRTITEADVVGFGTLTGDLHPQHVDADWAAESRFGERIAHGMLVASYAVGLLPLDPERVVALRKVDDLVFKRPVPLGTTIHVEGKVGSIREIDDGHGLVEVRLRVKTPAGLAVSMKVETVWRREPQTAEPVDSGDDQAGGGRFARSEATDALDAPIPL